MLQLGSIKSFVFSISLNAAAQSIPITLTPHPAFATNQRPMTRERLASNHTIIVLTTPVKSRGEHARETEYTEQIKPVAWWKWFITLLDRHNGALNAVFSGLVAAFTFALVVVGNRQHKAAMAAIALGRDEFAASHPPKLIVRRVSLDEGTIGTAPITRPWKVQYIVANTGGARATIYETNATIFCANDEDEGLPAIPPYDAGEDSQDEWSLEPGESRPRFVHLTDDQVNAARREWTETKQHVHRFYLIGYIQYRDVAGIVRRTAFCRVLDRKNKRFKLTTNPDYEYN
jgi:hypothetical protein